MDEDIKGVLSHGVSGPPLGIRAADIIEHGGRIRRRRKRLAVAGSSLATVAVITLGALAVGGRGVDAPAPVEPAGPGLSTIAPTPSVETPPTVPPEPGTRPDGTPGATSAPGADPRGVPSAARPQSPRQGVPAPPPAEKTAPGTTTPRSLPPPTAVTSLKGVR